MQAIMVITDFDNSEQRAHTKIGTSMQSMFQVERNSTLDVNESHVLEGCRMASDCGRALRMGT